MSFNAALDEIPIDIAQHGQEVGEWAQDLAEAIWNAALVLAAAEVRTHWHPCFSPDQADMIVGRILALRHPA